eukprot:983585-Rhodomonas_salina.2
MYHEQAQATVQAFNPQSVSITLWFAPLPPFTPPPLPFLLSSPSSSPPSSPSLLFRSLRSLLSLSSLISPLPLSSLFSLLLQSRTQLCAAKSKASHRVAGNAARRCPVLLASVPCYAKRGTELACGPMQSAVLS